MTYYLLFAECLGDVSYGVDYSVFLVDIFHSQEAAEECLHQFAFSSKPFHCDGGYLFPDMCGVYMTEDPEEMKRQGYTMESAISYCDLQYRIIPYIDTGHPAYIGGANYLE